MLIFWKSWACEGSHLKSSDNALFSAWLQENKAESRVLPWHLFRQVLCLCAWRETLMKVVWESSFPLGWRMRYHLFRHGHVCSLTTLPGDCCVWNKGQISWHRGKVNCQNSIEIAVKHGHTGFIPGIQASNPRLVSLTSCFIFIINFCKEAFSFPSWFVGRCCVGTRVVSGLSFQRSFTLQLLSCLGHFSRSLGTHFHFCISLFKPHLSPLSRWKSEAHIDKDNEHQLLALNNDNNR